MIEKNARENTEVMELWNWYKRTLKDSSISEIPNGYWHYGCFDNGVKIPKAARVFFRERADLRKYFEDPFITGGDSFFSWLSREEPSLLKA